MTGHAPAAEPPPFVWIEAEKPAASDVPVRPAGAGHPEWLSGEHWLFLSIDAADVPKKVPADGAVLKYPFTAPTTGDYDVWHRAGMEYVRSPFQWRLDDGSGRRFTRAIRSTRRST
ncbi:MAG: hypothetical protein U0736_12460 [Gemmataceae bacterium]